MSLKPCATARTGRARWRTGDQSWRNEGRRQGRRRGVAALRYSRIAMSRRIAIVEDEPAIRANYADALKKQGYEVATYANRGDALAALRTRLPDLALIDIGLGDEIDGGFALCRELRALSESLPIIFLSARDSDFDVVAGLRLGADDYLTKDVSLPHLSARIAALFRRSDLLAAPHAVEEVIERGPLKLDFKRLTAVLERQPRRPDADRILDGAYAGAASGPRQGPRQPDARRQHRRRRQHDHLARQAHPAQVRRRSTRRSIASRRSTAWAIAGTRPSNEPLSHRAGHPRATAAGADGVPDDTVARLRVRARARALPARRAAEDARRNRPGGGDGAARPAAAVRDAGRGSRVAGGATRAGRRAGGRSGAAALARVRSRGRAVGRNRADHPGPVADDRADLGDRSPARRAGARREPEAAAAAGDRRAGLGDPAPVAVDRARDAASAVHADPAPADRGFRRRARGARRDARARGRRRAVGHPDRSTGGRPATARRSSSRPRIRSGSATRSRAR